MLGSATHPSTGEAVTFENSAVDGFIPNKRDEPCAREFFDCLDFGKAQIDNGPSPAGNEGPYLKVPIDPARAKQTDRFAGTVHRVYRRPETRA